MPKHPVYMPELTDHARQALCHQLLAEAGAQNVTQRGDELWHSCVLGLGGHTRGDQDPSCSLNWQTLTVNCFGCGNAGGLLWFIATVRKERVGQAKAWITKRSRETGNDLASLLAAYEAAFSPATGPPPIPRLHPGTLDQFMAYTHPYLTEYRGVPEATVEHFRCGYDHERERVIIPHFWHGELTGWQSRRIYADGSPKYLSTPELPRRETVYNYTPDFRHAVVVESPLSVLRHWHHVPDIQATFGHEVTPRQIRQLASYGQVTLWFDNDPGTWKILQGTPATRFEPAVPGLLEQLGRRTSLSVVDSPWNEDPGGLDDDTVAQLVAAAVPWPIWQPPAVVETWEPIDAAQEVGTR